MFLEKMLWRKFLIFDLQILNMANVIEIPPKASKKKVREILEKVESLKKGKMAKHFGALKRGIDGLAYQKKVRDEWS
jgi:hypothetical protein